MKHHVNKAAKHWYVGVILVLAAAVGWMALGKGTIQQGCVVSEGANVTMDVVFGIGDNNGITIIDTTKEDVATKAGIYSPFKKYQPISIIIGNSTYLKAFEENIIGMRRGEEKTFVIPPENAYGYYNSSKRMILVYRVWIRDVKCAK